MLSGIDGLGRRVREHLRRALLIAFPALLALLASPATAVDYVWTAAVSGTWNDATKWTPNGIPNAATDTAAITVPGTYTVSVTSVSEVTGVSPELREELRAGWVEISPERPPLMLFRLGRAPAPSVRAGRPPLSHFMNDDFESAPTKLG